MINRLSIRKQCLGTVLKNEKKFIVVRCGLTDTSDTSCGSCTCHCDHRERFITLTCRKAPDTCYSIGQKCLVSYVQYPEYLAALLLFLLPLLSASAFYMLSTFYFKSANEMTGIISTFAGLGAGFLLAAAAEKFLTLLNPSRVVTNIPQ